MARRFSFTRVEDLEEAAQALGWHIEYRKLGRRKFCAEFLSSECDGISLVSEQFHNHLYVPCEPPDGFVGIFLPRLGTGSVVACGRVLTEESTIVFPASSSLDFTIKGEVGNYAIFLPESQFLATARAVAGSDVLKAPRSTTVLDGDRKHLAAIWQRIDSLLQIGDLDSENLSHLLSETILLLAAASSSSGTERLANGAAAAIAHRAQAYIEDRFQDAIRMPDLCTFTGVGLRTLQRCFSSHLQVSPTQYIKALRLNAARRALTATDAGCSISTVAMDNGFSHLGRFSVDYRARFGESPRQTLARTNARHQKATASHLPSHYQRVEPQAV